VNKNILLAGMTGMVGAMLMFLGDMLLYFTTEPITSFEEEIIGIMGGVGTPRLIMGGLLGPLSAFLYIVGFMQCYWAIKPAHKRAARVVFALLSLGVIYGGAFHTHFTPLGMLSALGHHNAVAELEAFAVLNFYGMFFPSLLGYAVLGYLMVAGKTDYPRWMVLFSPLIVFWLSGLMQDLPQPFKIIIAGGWSNLTFLIFFALSTYVLRRAATRLPSGVTRET